MSNIPSTSVSRQAKNKTKKSSTENKRKTSNVTMSTTQLSKLLVSVMNSGMNEALAWLKESLSDAIEDFCDSNNEGIPLLPIMDYADTAMENPEFQQILKAFGICEPFDEQETWWRIPSDLSIRTMTSFCDLIQQALDNTLIITEEADLENAASVSANMQHNNKDDNESSDDDIFEKLRGGTSKPREIKKPSDAYLDESNTIVPKPVVEILRDDSKNEINSNADGTTHSKKSRVMFDSDSDGNETKLEIHDNDSKRGRSPSNSDSDKPITKRTKVLLDSDDSE